VNGLFCNELAGSRSGTAGASTDQLLLLLLLLLCGIAWHAPSQHPPGNGLFAMSWLRVEPTWLVPSLACQPFLIFQAKGSVTSSSAGQEIQHC
jgi:hypothetical protein